MARLYSSASQQARSWQRSHALRWLQSFSALGALALTVLLAGCADDLVSGSEAPYAMAAPDLTAASGVGAEAPRSTARPLLRHPQLLDRATSPLKRSRVAQAGRSLDARRHAPAPLYTPSLDPQTPGASLNHPRLDATDESASEWTAVHAAVALDAPGVTEALQVGDEQTHLFLGFREYEADGVTPRVLDQWGITQRVLQEYGITRRVLQEYGITQRVLQEYGITQRVLQEYGGLTMGLLRDHGITSRVLQDYGVTEAKLQQDFDTRESVIRLRMRVSLTRPGISVSFGSDLLDRLLLELGEDRDLDFAEPDPQLGGTPFFSQDGLFEDGQILPWSTARIGAAFPAHEPDAPLHAFILDSGVLSADLKVIEAKDFTMLFVSRDVPTWEEEDFEHMPVFDPGTQGDPADETGHGTHVAGIVGAVDDGDGSVGVAPEVKLHSLKVLTDQGRTDVTTVVAAVDYVTDYKQRNPGHAVVMNLSLGMDIGSMAYNVLDEAVRRATLAGVVAVVSAGNDGADASTYSPAHVAEAITVGAYDQEGRFAPFSNYGPSVDVLAPGDLVPSLTHVEAEADAGEHVLMSGTSMAAPHVTGAALLFLYQEPQATPAEVKAALLGYSRPGIANVPTRTTDRSVHVADFAAPDDLKAFYFEKADWKGDALLVKGEGPRLDRVTFYDAVTGGELTQTVIRADGTFDFEFPLGTVPCAVQAVYLGYTQLPVATSVATENAPSSCDWAEEEMGTDFRVDRVEWKSGRLEVEGISLHQGTTIYIRNIANDAVVTTTLPNPMDEFKSEFPMTQPPCAVEIETAGKSAIRSVLNAPPSCSKRLTLAPPTWDANANDLTIGGLATGGATVSLYNADSDVLLATMTTGSVGAFGITMRLLPDVLPPCRLRAEGNLGEALEVNVGVPSCDPGFVYVERPPDVDQHPLSHVRIERARWWATHDRLVVRGQGYAGMTVTLIDPATGAVLATTLAGQDEDWEFRLNDLATIPCEVEIRLDGRVDRTDVRDAPSDCMAASGPTTSSTVEIKTAEWTPGNERLVVTGHGTVGVTATVRDSETGTALGTATADASGDWTLRVRRPDIVPCAVQVTMDGDSDTRVVIGAPPTCSTRVSSVDMARWWEAPRSRLVVRGRGIQEGDPVTVYDEAGALLGTAAVMNDKTWSFSLRFPGTIPCSVTVEIGTETLIAPVARAPGCDV
ncbi:MAG: S8 family serine peptidase [Bacteroidota bacterium]